ncbi:MAG TPA: hypothetical protein VHS09_11885 [Polyangiaceae bacterium]|nr:hypothetical protein [Polyangiaceae bacterium]
MASLAFRALLLVLPAACATPGPGPVVLAPSVAAQTPAARPAAPADVEKLAACALPWTLGDVEGGHGRVIVVCHADVHHQDVEPGAMVRALEPVLEPARQRVCACAARMPVPAFVDLVVTSMPDEGRGSLETGELDDELDRDVATAFMACVGTLTAPVPKAHLEACGTEKATLVYPLRVDLVP